MFCWPKFNTAISLWSSLKNDYLGSKMKVLKFSGFNLVISMSHLSKMKLSWISMNLDQWKCGCVPISGLDVCRFWFGRLEKWLSAVNRGFPFTATGPVWTDLNTFEQAWSPKFNIKQSKRLTAVDRKPVLFGFNHFRDYLAIFRHL